MKTYYVLAASKEIEVDADEVEIDTTTHNLVFSLNGEIVATFNHW